MIAGSPDVPLAPLSPVHEGKNSIRKKVKPPLLAWESFVAVHHLHPIITWDKLVFTLMVPLQLQWLANKGIGPSATCLLLSPTVTVEQHC